MRDVRVARREQDQVGPGERLERRPAPARASRRPRSGRRRPRRGAARATNHSWNGNVAGRRVDPGAERGRRSPAGGAPRRPSAAARRAVTAESGSPARSACVRTRWSPRSRSPSANQPSPPSSRHGLERVPRLAGAPPAALLVGEPGERVEHGVEIGRDVQAEHLDVVADVADHRQVGRRQRPRAGRRASAPRRRRRRGRDFSKRDGFDELRGARTRTRAEP